MNRSQLNDISPNKESFCSEICQHIRVAKEIQMFENDLHLTDSLSAARPPLPSRLRDSAAWRRGAGLCAAVAAARPRLGAVKAGRRPPPPPPTRRRTAGQPGTSESKRLMRLGVNHFIIRGCRCNLVGDPVRWRRGGQCRSGPCNNFIL